MEFKEAWRLWEQKRFQAAQDGFRDVLATTTDLNTKKRAWCGAAFMMVKLGKAEELEDWLVEGHRIGAGSVWAYEAALALFYRNDGYLDAVLRAAPPFDAATMNPWTRGLSTLPSTNWVDAPFEPIDFPSFDGSVNNPPLVLLASCDTNYFFRFADVLGGSKGPWHLHFHVILADGASQEAEQRRLVSQRIQELANSNATVSIEAKPGAAKAYMASRRYMLAPAALQHFGCPVLVCDIDLAIRADLTELPVHKPMLRYTDQLTLPWQKMTANACLLTQDAAGKHIASLMAKYLDQQFDQRTGDIWWVDQNAMLFATRASEIEFNRWGPRFTQTFQAPTLHGDRDKELRSPQR